MHVYAHLFVPGLSGELRSRKSRITGVPVRVKMLRVSGSFYAVFTVSPCIFGMPVFCRTI